MRQPPSGKEVANENEHPYIVELLAADDKLDVDLSRRITAFHTSRKIQVRHGWRNCQTRPNLFSMVFFSIRTRPAHSGNSSAENLQGAAARAAKTLTVRRRAVNIAKLPELSARLSPYSRNLAWLKGNAHEKSGPSHPRAPHPPNFSHGASAPCVPGNGGQTCTGR